jgi:rare lipoprotein A (peptidoglycan hydrolase)
MTSIQRTLTIFSALVAACASTVALAGEATAATTGGSRAPSGAPHASPSAKAHKNIATWFGPGFYGQKTACGQMLTPLVVGVANRTLPCGTLVQVSYHGRALTLPVLDRGPYSNFADWDLTAHAAEELGIEDTVRIATHIVGSEPNTPSLGAPAISPEALAAGGAQAG